jgi:hypothetical protein
MAKQLCAWFSPTMARVTGTVIYERADGERVELTCVSPTQYHRMQWKDVQYRGYVEKYVSQGRPRPSGTYRGVR